VSTSEQAKTQIIQLSQEGQRLDASDWDGVDRWVLASYETLRFSPANQAKFEEYCWSFCDPTSARVRPGVWMLKQTLLRQNCALDEDILEERQIQWEHSYWLRG
jgi:hypothetical protein